VFADAVAEVEPVYEDLPGWQESTAGVCKYAALPAAARRYLERVQEILEVPVDMISTGPDRDHTIVLRPPFAG
jgi:adenylosuccinate synthase